MSSIVPPLDYIPKLPGIGINKATQYFDKSVDKLVEKMANSIKEIDSLSEELKCDDPKITKARKLLEDTLKAINDVNSALQKIQQAINALKTIVNTAKAIKAAITSAQLLNPVTAPVFIATQLQAIQDATIVNAIDSLKQLKSIPPSLMGKLSSLVPVLIEAAARLAVPCDGVAPTVVLPDNLASTVNGNGDTDISDGSGGVSQDTPYIIDLFDETNGLYLGKYELVETNKQTGYWFLRVVEESTLINAIKTNKLGDIIRVTCPVGQIFKCTVISLTKVLTVGKFNLKTIEPLQSICPVIYTDADYNDFVETDFYKQENVSDEDLEFRSDTIELLLRQQQDLLTSLLEAPSHVYKGSGLPNDDLGKPGDFYVDLDSNKVYGPKNSTSNWGTKGYSTAKSVDTSNISNSTLASAIVSDSAAASTGMNPNINTSSI